jgi:hypothetical protein
MELTAVGIVEAIPSGAGYSVEETFGAIKEPCYESQ